MESSPGIDVPGEELLSVDVPEGELLWVDVPEGEHGVSGWLRRCESR